MRRISQNSRAQSLPFSSDVRFLPLPLDLCRIYLPHRDLNFKDHSLSLQEDALNSSVLESQFGERDLKHHEEHA